jgi:tRNA U54 and U55 pseudouridine synthase Pus10
MMQVSKRIPFEDPQVLMGVRILYVVSNLIIFGMYFYISTKIKAKRGMPQTPLTAKESRS